MTNKSWKGVFCALWTPTDARGRIDSAALKSNLQFVAKAGIEGALALGSTGEFLFLDSVTRKEFLAKVFAEFNRPVVANISDIRPNVVAELGKFARQQGAAAVALLPPYFFPYAQPDLTEFFVRAAEAAQLPMFLYNFPERSGNRIALETVAAVADRVPLAGVKQSGAEFEYHRALVDLGREKGFVVFTGSDTRLPEAMAQGVKGCVSGLANAVPEIVRDIFKSCESGAAATENGAVKQMRQIAQIVDTIAFPLNVAAIMEARGLSPGHPKSLVSVETRRKYQRLVDEFRALFKGWGLA